MAIPWAPCNPDVAALIMFALYSRTMFYPFLSGFGNYPEKGKLIKPRSPSQTT